MKFKSIQTQVGIYIAICSIVISVVLVLSSLSSSKNVQLLTEIGSKEIVFELVEKDCSGQLQPDTFFRDFS